MFNFPATPTADISPSPIVRDRLIRLPEVMETIGFRRTHIYEMVKTGQFPAPFKPSGSASRWSENEVLTWVAAFTGQKFH